MSSHVTRIVTAEAHELADAIIALIGEGKDA